MMTWVGVTMWVSLLGLIAEGGDTWNTKPRLDRTVTAVLTIFVCVPTFWFTVWVLLPLYGIGGHYGS